MPEVGPGPQPRPRVLRPVPAPAGAGQRRTEGEAPKAVRDEVRGDGDRGAQDPRVIGAVGGVVGDAERQPLVGEQSGVDQPARLPADELRKGIGAHGDVLPDRQICGRPDHERCRSGRRDRRELGGRSQQERRMAHQQPVTAAQVRRGPQAPQHDVAGPAGQERIELVENLVPVGRWSKQHDAVEEARRVAVVGQDEPVGVYDRPARCRCERDVLLRPVVDEAPAQRVGVWCRRFPAVGQMRLCHGGCCCGHGGDATNAHCQPPVCGLSAVRQRCGGAFMAHARGMTMEHCLL
ncbi:MAG: hypothetical protein QOI36_5978 [Pseudonocardiales bacterium]|nr:hypothetical protein [Pseudonocardiales bacterium]